VARMNSNIWSWADRCGTDIYHYGCMGPLVWYGHISFMLQGPTGVARMYSNIWSWADWCGTDISLWVALAHRCGTDIYHYRVAWAHRCGTDIYHLCYKGQLVWHGYIIIGWHGPTVRHGRISLWVSLIRYSCLSGQPVPIGYNLCFGLSVSTSYPIIPAGDR